MKSSLDKDEHKDIANHFNSVAARWAKNPKHQRNLAFFTAMQKLVPFHSQMRLADYGCATGDLSILFAEHVQNVEAWDIAEAMIEQLQIKVKEHNIKNIYSTVLNTELSNFPKQPYYDVIFSTMTLHHIPNVSNLIKQLANALKSQGTILLADLDKEDGSFHEDSQGVFHYGFEREQVQDWLQAAGFIDIEFVTPYVIEKDYGDYPLFLVKGIKN